jgi:TfoX/Sxy family transcriptional regulator of competence genes
VTRDFATVARALSGEPGVTKGRMFGSDGLKVGKQVFAMVVKGKLVVKLSAERTEELRARAGVAAFDPGHGRPMKQWIAVGPSSRLDWLAVAREALAYVRGG